MDDDRLKQLWLSSGNEQRRVEINTDLLIGSLTPKIKSMEKRIRRRDSREILVCICMIPLFGWWLITIPQLFAKIGSAIIIAACLLVIFRLIRARRVNIKEDAASEIRHNLAISLQLIRQQIKLLDTLLWWYLLPFFTGIIFFYSSLTNSILSKAIYSVIVVTVYGYIYYLNKKAIKIHLKPMEEHLARILNDLSASETLSSNGGNEIQS